VNWENNRGCFKTNRVLKLVQLLNQRGEELMNKRINGTFFYSFVAALFAAAFIFTAACAGTPADTSPETPADSLADIPAAPAPATPVYWTGNGDADLSIAVLEPAGKNMPNGERRILALIRDPLPGIFRNIRP
jgi:hypothetical protein